MPPVHDVIVRPQIRPLVGSVPVHGDESIGQLALVCAALADGPSEIRRLSIGVHVGATLGALRALGVSLELDRGGVVRVSGRSLFGLLAPKEPLACGGSATTVRLLSGVLIAQPFPTMIDGDAALASGDFGETVGVLRRRGGPIEGVLSPTRPGHVALPLTVGPLPAYRRLSGLEYELRSAAPGLKGALLISGLYADAPTYIREPIVTRDHAERMLQALDVPLTMLGPMAKLDVEPWDAKLPPFAADVPGDFSAAAFVLGAAAVVPGSRVCARNAGLNPTRTGVMDLLRQMGGAVEAEIHASILGEPEGTVCCSHAPLRGTTMAGEVLVRASDDLSTLVALAARAHGSSEIGGGVERATVERFASVLRAFGVTAETSVDGLFVEGRPDESLDGADIDATGEADAGAAAVLLGLSAAAPTRVRGIDALANRLPRFVGILRALGADLRVEERGM